MDEFEPVFINSPYTVIPNDGVCKYNSAVLCATKMCGKCGWNPDNTNLHNARLRAQMEAYQTWDGK